jgi:hypothetical protein
MEKYCIWIVSPPGYTHSHVFDDFAAGLQSAFQDLGFAAPVILNPQEIQGRPIILGCNLLHCYPGLELPKDSILYNLEQVLPGSPWITQTYIETLKQFQVWDYSRANIHQLNTLGVQNIQYAGVGYAKVLTHIPRMHKDIDVLFYGSICERRIRILSALQEHGVNVQVLFNAYGKERDIAIARSKIVLNIHYYESKVFEILRVTYLLANKVFVISETGNDPDLEAPFENGLVFAGYEQIIDACEKYLRMDVKRQSIADQGYRKVRALRQADLLQAALKNYQLSFERTSL